MSDKLCGACKKFIYNGDAGPRKGTCMKIKEGPYQGGDPNELACMVMVDFGSGGGWLQVHETFGCILWEAKESGDE